MQIVAGIFVILHGLVHMWYVTLSQRWVEFQPEMGWTGMSWLLAGFIGADLTHKMATIFYGLATLAFLIGGVGLLAGKDWFQPIMIGASVISIVSILIFWDGNFSMLVQKGFIGLLISTGVLAAALIYK